MRVCLEFTSLLWFIIFDKEIKVDKKGTKCISPRGHERIMKVHLLQKVKIAVIKMSSSYSQLI